jgi:dihydropteroate synthase
MTKPTHLLCRQYTLDLRRPLIMGVLNITPDSFSDGGPFQDPQAAVRHAQRMAGEGADIIDVGAESSRPGSDPVCEHEELARLQPVIKRLIEEVAVPVSVDTCKPAVADQTLYLGAHIINDISGLRDERMLEVVARHGVPVVAMHMRGEPKTMQNDPQYTDVVAEVHQSLEESIQRARRTGIQQVIIDPGIGFGKTAEHNLLLLKRLTEFSSLGCPLLVGTSRKSFIGRITGAEVGDRLSGTLATVAIAVLHGADIVRVHDVRQCREAALIAHAVRRAYSLPPTST